MDKRNEEKNKKNNDVVVVITIITVSLIFILTICYLLLVQNLNKNIEFELIGKENIEIEVGEKYLEEGSIAKCNNKDISNKIELKSNVDENKVGQYLVQYKIKSNFLHEEKTLYRNVYIKDSTSPEIEVKGNKEYSIEVGEKFTVPECKAIDNYDGDITSKVEIESNVDTSKPGTYTVNYRVEDSNGNEATKQIQVTVKKKKNPYIIVSIANQTLTYYEYDKAVLSSNIVTGKDGRTPKGTFKVLNKARNIILKGKDYESFVNYWIAFRGVSLGFHDASWRSNFGGTIYKTNGSHGCVNMPYNKVKQLYNMVPIGTPVYIK